jgi:hypothetical protein
MGFLPLLSFLMKKMKFSADWIRLLAGLLQVRGEEAQVRTHLGCRFHGGLWPRPRHPIRFMRINPSFPIFSLTQEGPSEFSDLEWSFVSVQKNVALLHESLGEFSFHGEDEAIHTLWVRVSIPFPSKGKEV